MGSYTVQTQFDRTISHGAITIYFGLSQSKHGTL